MKKSKKDIKNKKLPDKEQKKGELTDKELKDISGGTTRIISTWEWREQQIKKKAEEILRSIKFWDGRN